MKKTTGLLALLLCVACMGKMTPAHAALGQEEGFEYLLYSEMPLVVTASKTSQSVERSTSVVTVITAREIRQWGCRTLHELLQRVPGFFPSQQATWEVIGSRGLTSDGNDHILLLIDGHPQNSVIGQGFQQQDLAPVLEKVDRIEIIRGPGSVLWGSSAVYGIVNILTKQRKDDSQVSAAYGNADGMFSVNYLTPVGGDTSGIQGNFSLSYWKSDGFNRDSISGPGQLSQDPVAARQIHANLEFPWGKVGDWPAVNKQREGYEAYLNAKIGEGDVILARVLKTSLQYPWDTWLQKPGSDLTARQAYLSYQKTFTLSENIHLQSTAWGDLLLQNRFPFYGSLFKPTSGVTVLQDQSNEEQAFGFDFLGDLQFDRHSIKIGLTGVRTLIGPNRDARFDIQNNQPVAVRDGTNLTHLGVESGYDNNAALYGEDIFSLNENTSLFLGARYDHNDFRENRGVFLPRAGVTQSLGDEWTAKYIYNTGYLRPAAVYSKTSGVIVDPQRGPNQSILVVDKSEKIQGHDVQWYWKRDLDYAALTLFYMQVENYISFDANHLPQGYKNLGDATTHGLEMEAKYHFFGRFALSFNYSYALATLDREAHRGALTNNDDKTLNYPQHIYNLGMDWLINSSNTVNVNVNGWRTMNVIVPIGETTSGEGFSSLDGEEYVDLNYISYDVLSAPLDVSIFVNNVFDNQEPVGLVVNNGFWYPRGRNVGATVNFKW